jgi:two-component system response regulator HydG
MLVEKSRAKAVPPDTDSETKPCLVIVDDDPGVLESLGRALEDLEYDLVTTTKPVEALDLIRARLPPVVITDLKMPEMDGLALLQRIKDFNPHIQVIMITGHGSVDDAVAAMKKGAYDFISKPFNTTEITVVISRAIEKASLVRENLLLREKLRKSQQPSFATGKNAEFKELLERAVQAAASDATILISGESGTGKEVLANYIVANSPRAAQPFVTVNCAAIPENLIEAELFGFKKGSFTGAHQDKKGKFLEADGGTIFLDEIGEVPLSVQSKLLRILQEGEVSPVGGAARRVNVRIIAATNKHLRKMVNSGQFREDLFYRLNVIPLTIPPLRQRLEDLTAYISFFVAKYCKKNNRGNLSLSADALRMMEDYSWPGNIRELENAIERAVILCLGHQITVKDLPGELSGDGDGDTELRFRRGMLLEEIEMLVIQDTLKRNHGDRARTAAELGIGVRTVYRKLSELNAKETGAQENSGTESAE